MKKRKIAILIFELLIFITGVVLLIQTDWKIFVGVFLMMWANNMAQSSK